MLIANISRNIVQEARKFISDTQTRSVRSRQNRPQNKPNEDVSVATEQGPDTTRFVPVDTTHQMQVESNLREARDWADEFYGSRRIGQVLSTSMPSDDLGTASQVVSVQQLTQGLRQVSRINGQQRAPYSNSDPEPIVITTGVQENGLALNRVL